ncbi:hypothetical protein JCM3765_005302 [Sporobolomyces pararoseus]
MSAPIKVPEQPRLSSTSTSDDESGSSSPPPQLDPSTLALLNSFYQEREQQEQEFRELEEKAHKRLLKTQQESETQTTEGETEEEEEDKMMSIEEFRKLFQEDWQLSQFWYTSTFASKLCKFIHSFSSTSSRIAFLCCPTSYVAFRNQNPSLRDVWLLEYDQRFELLDSQKFVHYDLEQPERIPKHLWGTIDIAIADPPFLNKVTNQHLSEGLKKLLKPKEQGGKLILLTSTSVSSLPEIYSKKSGLGPLEETDLRVEHAGGIQNEFRVWTSWKFQGEREGIKLVDDPVFKYD